MHFGPGVSTSIAVVGGYHMLFVSEWDDVWNTAALEALMIVLGMALVSCANCSMVPQLCCRSPPQGCLFTGLHLCPMCWECTGGCLYCHSGGVTKQVFFWEFTRQVDVLCGLDHSVKQVIAVQTLQKSRVSLLFGQSDMRYNLTKNFKPHPGRDPAGGPPPTAAFL
jgi:hypothetical protein